MAEASNFVDLSHPHSWQAPQEHETRTIRVKDDDRKEVTFKVKHTTKLYVVFNAYATDKGIGDPTLARFHFNGIPITNADQTPGDLGIEDGGVVDFSITTNARHEIEKLLATETSPGKYCTGAEITGVPIPSVEVLVQNENGDEVGTRKLSFPLTARDIEDIKENAERAGVGVGERTVVNLDVRKTWQIKPHGLRVSNVEQALEMALQTVASDFGTEADYDIEAHLYKLLLYEEGCFFARHRDNERLDGMVATLVLELPSEYSGACLSVYSPLTPDEKTTYTFNGGKPRRKRTRSNKPGLHFAAFYADCYHEVNNLTEGHRVALVYHLTATPKPGHRRIFCALTNHWRSGTAGQHLPAISPSPPQPVDESLVVRLSNLVEKLSSESDDDYQWMHYDGISASPPLGKPKKLAIVLSHHYTPASFTGIDALKGSDRSLAQVILAAMRKKPGDATGLARLAAKKVVEVGGGEYAADPEAVQVHNLVADQFKEKDGGELFFDAALSLATVWDNGECTPVPGRYGYPEDKPSTFQTGPLIPLTSKQGLQIDLGPKLAGDRVADWHPSWFGGQDSQGPPFQFHGPYDYITMAPTYDFEGPIVYGEQVRVNYEHNNHSLPIYSQELLFASEEARCKYHKEADDGKHVVLRDSPKQVEFLGNGGCYEGRVYSRAVILIWPKAHRRDVQMQSKGGKAVLEEESKVGS